MVLEEMFRGNFHPAEINDSCDPNYRAAVKKVCQLEDQLNPLLTPDQRTMLDDLLAQIYTVQCMDLERSFSFAFSAGILLQQEVQAQMELWQNQ